MPALVAPAAAATTPTGAVAGGPPVCRSVSVPVTIDVALPATVHATLCTPATGPTATELVGMPGATYDGQYFLGEQIPAYSFSDQMGRAGQTTLVIDPLGTGGSTRPLSALVTGTTQAAAIHQVIEASRDGRIDGVHHTTIIEVGHSLGSMMSVLAATDYPGDIQGLALTGYTSTLSAATLTQALLDSLRPAVLADFPGTLDPGWLTTLPGTRAGLFDAPGDVDPAMVAADEAHRDVVSAAEIPDALLGLSPLLTRTITVPTIVLDGSQDTVFCGALTPGCPSAAALYRSEQPDWTAQLATAVLPGAGHSLFVSAHEPQAAAVLRRWVVSVESDHPLTGPLTVSGATP